MTGVAIALGLDYDILLVTRIVEFREQGFSDKASVFRGATKAGGVISGAGLIMCLAFTGLCFSDKLLMQQFGVLLITSVLFDTFADAHCAGMELVATTDAASHVHKLGR